MGCGGSVSNLDNYAARPRFVSDVAVSSLAASRPGTTIVVPQGGLLEWDGTPAGVEAFVHGIGPHKVTAGGTLPAPADGKLELVQTGSVGILRIFHWPPELVAWRLSAPLGLIADRLKTLGAKGSNAATRQALTTAAPGTFTCAADTVRCIVRAKNSNAAVAHIAPDAAKVAVAASRYELGQGDWIELTKPDGAALSFGFDGTTGDHLFIWEHKGA